MNEQPKDSSFLQRLAAINLLRENIFYSDPSKYSFSDIVEDLPGAFRPASSVVRNILPSFAIISKDPEQRREQLRQAVEKVKNSKEAPEGLGKEMLHNAVNVGSHALIPGFLLSSAVKLLGFRSPFLKGKIRSPISPVATIKKVLKSRPYSKELFSHAAKDAFIGAGLGAASGAIYPLIANATNISDKSLEEARDILQNHPYASALPGAEVVSALRYGDKDKTTNKIQNLLTSGAIGTAAGGLLGGVHAVSPSLIKGLGLVLRSAITKKPLTSKLGPVFKQELHKDVLSGASLGAGAGLLGGMLANSYT